MKGSCWALCGFWGSCPHSGMGLSRPTPCRMPRDDVACVLIFPPRVQELSTKDTHHQASHRMPRRWNDFGAVLGICFRLCYCWQSMLMTMAWSWHRMRCNAWHMRIRRQMATELWSLEWFEVFSWYSMTSIGALSIYFFPWMIFHPGASSWRVFPSSCSAPPTSSSCNEGDKTNELFMTHRTQNYKHVSMSWEDFPNSEAEPATFSTQGAPKPCTDTDAGTRKMRQQAMLSALRQAATSGEQFHGLVDEARLVEQKHAVFSRVHVFVVAQQDAQCNLMILKRHLCRYYLQSFEIADCCGQVMAEVQSRESVLSVTGELTGTLASLHSDAQARDAVTHRVYGAQFSSHSWSWPAGDWPLDCEWWSTRRWGGRWFVIVACEWTGEEKHSIQVYHWDLRKSWKHHETMKFMMETARCKVRRPHLQSRQSCGLFVP